uniref:Uncharacterized protein n=1 Tax=Fagus sylvatica TaxID=28930 RepID=A0A2N9IAQ7_FAGSY
MHWFLGRIFQCHKGNRVECPVTGIVMPGEEFISDVSDLIDHGILKFEGVPNIITNPLPNNPEGNVGIVLVEEDDRIDLNTVQIPWKRLFYALRRQGYLDPLGVHGGEPSEDGCEYHSGAKGHSLDSCEEFKKEVTSLAAMGIIRRKPVPWNYIMHIVTTRGIERRMDETDVDNLSSGLGGITRSGRCYTSEELKKRRKELSKAVEDPLKKKVTKEEVEDFL